MCRHADKKLSRPLDQTVTRKIVDGLDDDDDDDDCDETTKFGKRYVCCVERLQNK